MPTIALEFVPPDREGGPERARDEAARARELMREAGILDRVNTLLIPGMIAEESDRPVPLTDKLDPLEVRLATRETLPLGCIITQVTAFSSSDELHERLANLRSADVERVIFVGVPRTHADGEGPGLAPADALGLFREVVDRRGVILIPTRQDEKPRLEAKIAAGADFALCQLLFSDFITGFVPTLEVDEPRPEIILSFGYVPKAEQRVGLIRWLIRDETDAARREMQWVLDVADRPFPEKKAALVDVYRRVTDGLRERGYPLGVHFETPYGFSPWAFEVFAEMLEAWTPDGA